MGIADALTAVHWLAVLAATAAAFTLGALWYSKFLFGAAWMQEVGLSDESFLGAGSTWLTGLQSGLIIGICWIATAYGVTYLFELRSLRLFRINAGYYVVSFGVMATIIGAWH
jgi:hypothetical protein